MAQKAEFKIKVGEEELVYAVRMPTSKVRAEAREYKNRVFKREMFKLDENGKNAAILSNQVYNLMKANGVWTDEKDQEVKDITRKIEEKIRLLSRGKSDEVPSIAKLREIIVKEVKPLRSKQFELLGESRQYEGLTVESIASQAETDYLVYKSTFDQTDGKDDQVFSSVEDVQARSSEPVTQEAETQLGILIGTINPNWIMELPENKILKKHKLIDDKGRYVLNGKIVNVDGKEINEEGYLIDGDGCLVNEFGDKIDKEGNLLESVPFDEESGE